MIPIYCECAKSHDKVTKHDGKTNGGHFTLLRGKEEINLNCWGKINRSFCPVNVEGRVERGGQDAALVFNLCNLLSKQPYSLVSAV